MSTDIIVSLVGAIGILAGILVKSGMDGFSQRKQRRREDHIRWLDASWNICRTFVGAIYEGIVHLPQEYARPLFISKERDDFVIGVGFQDSPTIDFKAAAKALEDVDPLLRKSIGEMGLVADRELVEKAERLRGALIVIKQDLVKCVSDPTEEAFQPLQYHLKRFPPFLYDFQEKARKILGVPGRAVPSWQSLPIQFSASSTKSRK